MERIRNKAVIFAGVALILTSAVAIAIALWQMRNDAIADATRNAENIAIILGEQTNNSIQSIEIIIDEIIAKIRGNGTSPAVDLTDCGAQNEIYDFLINRLARIPQASIISVDDNAGHMVCNSVTTSTRVDVSDREYYQHVSTSRDLRLYVSQPLKSRALKEWIVYFSKRLESADGKFVGIVKVGVRTDHLSRMFSALSGIPGEAITLLRRDGTILMRYPDLEGKIGDKMPSGSQWYGAVDANGGGYLSPGVFDGQARRVVVRPLDRYPVVVDVSAPEDQVLAVWRARAGAIAACSVAIESAFAWLLRSLHRQIKRLRRSETLLAEKSNEAQLANARFTAALSSMSHGVAIFDQQGRIQVFNRKYEESLDLDPNELRAGAGVTDILAGCATAATRPAEALEAVADPLPFARWAGSPTVLTSPGGRRIRLTVDPMPDGGWVAAHEDITQSERANQRVAYLAHHDTLTGLANRAGFMARLEALVSAKETTHLAALLIDLDRFKEVNDTFGHSAGDALLASVAARLEAAARDGDIVARLGGDEFAMLRPVDAGRIADVEALAHRIRTAAGASYVLDGVEITVGVSIGIAITVTSEPDPQHVLRRADLALYRAKSDGRDCYRVFEQAMEDEFQSRQQLVRDLRVAIDQDELQLYYQPIVDAASREIQSMEALARWTHPTRGMIPPLTFIGLAEDSGLIHDLGAWVLRRACRDAKDWPTHVRVAVNVSPIQFSQNRMPRLVEAALRESGLPADRLDIEITESTLLGDSKAALIALEALRGMGISIVLDDFGTGYSSLSYLKLFPFHELKIDKSFIDDIAGHRGCAQIVSAITSLARGFEMLTTAEGVETREQYELLRAAAVGRMQGYLFGRPAPAASWDFSRPLLAA